MNFKCLNVKIDNLTKKEILGKINYAKGLQIATVNPEFILEAQENEKFRNILNSKQTLSVADGIGLKFAFWRYGQNLKYRWAGVDLMWEILKIANEKKWGVFLIGNKNGLSTWQETADVIRETYPSLEVRGVNVEVVGGISEDLRFKIYDLRDSTPKVHQSDIFFLKSYIVNHKSDIVFCSLGAPQQEILLNKLKSNAKLVMGVGGSFDFITGKVKRAPGFLRKIGLEWLWRLIIEPRYRLKRIWRAVVIFPVKIIFNKQ